LRLDHDHAVARDALIAQSKESRLHVVRQRRAVCGIEPKMRGARDFVDVLPAGALCADGRELDFLVRNLDARTDTQSQESSSASVDRRFTTSTRPASPSTRTQSPVSMISSGSRSRSVTAGTRITTAPSATFVVISLKTIAFGALPA